MNEGPFYSRFLKNILPLPYGINPHLSRFAWCTRQGHRKMPSYMQIEKEKLMKTALIRVLAIATLASSISAFAAADEPKPNDAATTSATKQQDGCAESAGHGKKQKNAKGQRDDQRTEQQKEFDRLLMGIYG
jgi:hypothetical protein